MKEGNPQKKKLWLWIAIGAAVLAIAGTVLGFILFGGESAGKEEEITSDLYWNIDGKSYTGGSTGGLSTRQPDADGKYHILFACNGEQVEKVVTNKKLVNSIDNQTIMGLQFDEEGVVTGVIPMDKLATQKVKNSYIQKIEGGVIHANASSLLNGMATKTTVTEKTVIYDMTGERSTVGKIISVDDLKFMDSIQVLEDLSGENIYIFLLNHISSSALYWRSEQMWDFTNNKSLRVPDADGVYTMDFCCNGEIVTLKTTNPEIPDAVDSLSPYSAHLCFEFDDQGFIIDLRPGQSGAFGAVVRERGLVTSVEGSTFTATDILTAGAGAVYTGTLPEDCIIYDASQSARVEGRQGQPVEGIQVGDVVNVWVDGNGKPVIVYIAHRLIEHSAYWNVSRRYDATKKQTTREPNADGYYEIEMIELGKIGKKTFKTKDINLVNLIDSNSNRTCGMKVNGSYIEFVYDSDAVFGYAPVLGDTCVSAIAGNLVSVIRYVDPKSPATITLAPDVKVYDVSGIGDFGQETTVRIGDHVYPHRDLNGQIAAVLVTKRVMGAETLYYNLDYQFNSSTGKTNRKPDADGWYVFTMANQGKQVQIKTQDAKLADALEGSSSGLSMAIIQKDGVAQKVFHPAWAFSQPLSTSHRVVKINSNGTLVIEPDGGGEQTTVKLKEGCNIYNVSTVYDDYRGEKTNTVKIGDMVTILADYESEAEVVLIRFRKVDNIYWKKSITAEPDADGWYYCELAVDGELKTFKTQREDVASSIRGVSYAFGLRVDGDVILNYVYFNEIEDVRSAGFTEWDIVSVDGSSFTCQYNQPAHEATGTQETRTLSKDYKVFDVSPTAEKFGAETELRPGDRVRSYEDADGNHKFFYVKFRATREKGVYGYCEHCDQKVTWLPWVGGSWHTETAHYYLNDDVTITGQSNVGTDGKTYEIILDLNGKTYKTVNSRSFLVFKESTLTILDSVGGGEIVSTGTSAGNGGIGMVSSATLNLLSGTLRVEESDQIICRGGALIFDSGATLNMRGGKITGGKALKGEHGDGYGGNIYVQGGTLNLYGGVVENGYANENGGNIYNHSSTVNLFGAKLVNGEAKANGGNIFCAGNTVTNLLGGSVTGGVTNSRDGNNLYIYHDGANLTIGSCTVDGGVFIGQIGDFVLTGKPVIGMGTGESEGMYLNKDVKLTAKDLVDGAEVYVSAKGVFTTPDEKLAEYADAEYFKSTSDVLLVGYDEQEKVLFIDAPKGLCTHCGQMVPWYPWTGGEPISGHYYLDGDMTSTQAKINVGEEVILDLRGHKLSAENTRVFLVYGDLTIMDSVGGGEVTSTGFSAGHGGVMMVTRGKVTLLNGKITMTESDQKVSSGGIMILEESTLNVYGGEISGGKAQGHGGNNATYKAGLGGNIYAAKSNINIYGGKISGGLATDLGGNLYLKETNFTMTGGVIEGGTARNGGSIYLHESVDGVSYKAIIKDDGDDQTALPVITGGIAVGNGGNIYANGLITIEAGSVTAGQSGNFGGNFYGEVSVNLGASVFGSGAVIDGGIAPAGGNVALYQAALDIRQGAVVSNGICNYTSGNYGGGGNLFVFVSSVRIAGTVTGGRADTLTGGNILSRTNSTVEICEGALIEGGYAKYDGGNFSLASGTVFTMTGGTVTGGEAGRWGGNLYLENTNFTMTGGIVDGGTSVNGGSIFIHKSINGTDYKAVIKDDGNDATPLPVINGGKATSHGGNIYTNGLITIEAGSVTNGEANNFGGNIYFETSKDIGTNVLGSGAVIDGGTAPAGGNIALYQAKVDIQQGAMISGGISNYTNQTFGGGGNIFAHTSSAKIAGTVTGGKADSLTGGNIIARNNSQIEISEGALIENGSAKWDGGNIYMVSGSGLTMTGGTVTGGSATRWGGNIFSEAALSINGGVVENGAAGTGSDLYLAATATVTLENCTISGDAYAEGGITKLEVVGAPELSNLILAENALITVGELIDGANIFITAADGQISVVNADAEDYVDFFETESGKKIFFDSSLNALAKGEE